MTTIKIDSQPIHRRADLARVGAAALLAFYNERAGRATKKFASRERGEAQVWALIRDEVAAAPVSSFDYPPAKALCPHRPGTKRARLVELLERGATLGEVMADIGWKARDARDGIRLLNRHLGYGLKTDKAGVIRLVHPK